MSDSHDRKPRDKLRLEITGVEFQIWNGDFLLGDSRAGTVQFHAGKTAARVVRRLRKAGIEVIFPRHFRPDEKL